MSEWWPRLRLGAAYDVRDQRAGAEAESLPLMSVSQIRGVIPRSELVGDQGRAEDLANYKVCEPGDIVLNRMSAYNGALGVAQARGVVSPDYLVMTPRPTVCPEFIAAWLKTPIGVFEMTSRLRGIGSVDAAQVRTPRVNESDLKTISLAMPPVEEQRAIAGYLDRETARVDTLIEEQQRLIEMLRERRRDLIRASVLGSENPLAPSAEASFTAIGHHFSVTLGKMLDAGKAVRADALMLPYIRAGNIHDDGLKLNDVKEMPYSASEAAWLDLRAGDLLVVEGGAVGTNVVLRDDMPGWSFQKTVNRLRPTDGWSSGWLGYLLRTYRDIGAIDIVCNKSTIPHLTAEKLRAMRVPSVPPEEQVRIVEMLDQETSKIDALLAETQAFIELSRERRSALITAAVTGQIDLRDEVA